MKLMRDLTAAFLVSMILAACALGQAAAKPTPVPNPSFDPALAKKLGADQRGMRNYVLAILKSGPNYDKVKGDERAKIFEGHFANINRMAKEGTLLVAGPFGDDTGDWAGLYLFNVKTIDEARKLTETDPTIKAGVFIGEFHKWYGSAAMMEIIRIHNTITPNLP